MSEVISSSAHPRGMRPWWRRKAWLITGVALLAGIAAAVFVFAVKWPFTREAMTKRLEKASSAHVEFGAFHSTYFPPGCVAESVIFRRADDARGGTPEPLLTVKKLTIESTYDGLFSSPKRISRIVVDGVHLRVPGQAGTLASQQPQQDQRHDHAGPQERPTGESLEIDEFRVVDAFLEIPSKKASARPFSIPIHEAVFRRVSEHHTMPFTLSLHLPVPPGEISAKGWIGPWRDQKGAVRSTPVSGECVLKQGNLGVFKTLAGSISAQVSFSGTLEKLDVSGTTDSPDFEVKKSGHRTPLSTQFSGTVDLLTGDVALPQLNARLGHTNLMGGANITGNPKTVDLDVKQGRGEIQDLFLLFSNSDRSPVTGPILFHTRISLPPEARPFEKRVRLAGDFTVDPAQFTSNNTQQRVDQLSARARGDKEQSKDEDDPEQVISHLKGRVVLQNGIANFSAISFSVPGASANMHGTYNLSDKHVKLSGKMKMQATVSQATHGVKSFFLKLLDPFFKKKKAGAEVPVTMTGSYGHTHFSAGLK
jgi:hypothetical protein